MAIQPITSANFFSARENITFGKRSESKKNQTNSIKASAIAVPLTTLIALSPLNNAQASSRNNVFGDISTKIEMIDSPANTESVSAVKEEEKLKTYKEVSVRGDNGEKYVLFFNSRNMDGKIQQVQVLVGDDNLSPEDAKRLDATDGYYQVIQLGEVRPVTLRVVGDDQQERTTISFNQLLMKKGEIDFGYNYKKGVSSLKMARYIKDFVDGKIPGLVNDGAIIKGEPIDIKVSPGSSGNLQNGVSKDSAWLRVGKYAKKQNFGTLMLETEIQTDYGKYTLRAYNTDGNSDDFEAVTVQKEGEGEFEVAKLELSKMHFADYASIGKIDLGFINLYKAYTQKTKVARVLDDKLFMTLVEVMNDTRFNSAYKLNEMETEMRFYGEGVLYSVNK